MIPRWLQAHLEATGRADTDGISRQISAGTCRKCRRPVIRGLDADRCALPAVADPTPLSIPAEVAALLAGAQTYDLIHEGNHYELDRRDRWRIAGRRKHPVLPEHRCDTHWPVDADDQAPAPKETHDVPQF